VRETLTNAARHCPGSHVEVRLSSDRDHLHIAVVNGPARLPIGTDLGAGQGLRGLTERVAIAGGTLTAGPTGTGFAVHARLPQPLPSTESAPDAEPAPERPRSAGVVP
jgi:signal transduction histidine kinase